MIISEFEYTLKDGRIAIIRSPKEEDISGLLAYMYETACETDFLLRYPEECSKYTAEGEKIFIDKVNSSGHEAMLVCLVDKKIAAVCNISCGQGIKTRHRANIAIAVLRDFWGQGIGTRMISELISIAEKNENIIQLELDFIEGNTRARALYEKMGFRITGVKPNAIRLKDGTLLNEYSMIRNIYH